MKDFKSRLAEAMTEKNIKAGIIKMFQQSTTDYLRKNFKIENLGNSGKAYLKKKRKWKI